MHDRKLPILLAGAAVAVAVFALLLVAQHAWADHQAVHLYDQILGYNLRVGRLVMPQAPTPAGATDQPPEAPPAPPKPK